MKNQHINDIFSALAPTESQRRRLLAPPARLQPAHGPGYWAGATALCLAAVLAALWLWPAAPRPLPASSSAPPSSLGTAPRSGFVLTAYAGDVLTPDYETAAAPTVLQPRVEVPLAAYSPLQSDVPGLPFTFGGSQSLTVSADQGALCRWDRASGVVSPCGSSAAVQPGETLYWSPLSGERSVQDATLTVSSAEGRQCLRLHSEDGMTYTAVAGDFEALGG